MTRVVQNVIKQPRGALNPDPQRNGAHLYDCDLLVCVRMQGWRSTVIESREVMNVRQASQYLGISPDTLYRYITEGEIPAFKLGNRWKLRKTILDRWMERKMTQSAGRRR